MAALEVEPSGGACGARVTGVDLSAPLDAATLAAIRAAWLEHLVLAFPGQQMDDDALERFTLAMGGFGEDPFFAPIPGREHIAAIRREADETSPIFAENWHSDWSFQLRPPAGTCLLAIDVPPVGGDTLFANQHAAWEALPEARKAELGDLVAVHSARYAYAPDGTYGARDKGRSMDIRPGEAAMETQLHPLVPAHPETGRRGFFSTLGYIVGIDGMAQDEALPLLRELHAWQGDARFVYAQKWEPGMLVMWDNRSVLHRATGGYEGQRRELHRTTIAAAPLPDVAYKVLTAPQMAELLGDGVFKGAPIDLADGYVHLSAGSQVTGTVDKHFAGQTDLHIAAVDLAALGDAVKWEVSRGGALFPHLYAQLPLSAVIAHAPVTRGADGSVVLPGVG